MAIGSNPLSSTREVAASMRGFLFLCIPRGWSVIPASKSLRLTKAGREILRENVTRRETWLAEAIDQSLTTEERGLLFKAGELLDRIAAYRPLS
jgi:hypothetical protein